MCAELGTAPKNAEEIYVGIGPGSYTGLRVGIATALGLAYGTGARLRSVPSFEALAYEGLREKEEAFVAWNARAGRFYFAHYRRLEADVEPILAPKAITPEELRERLQTKLSIFADDTLIEAAQLDAAQSARARMDRMPQASAILALGPLRAERELDTLEPLYLREHGE